MQPKTILLRFPIVQHKAIAKGNHAANDHAYSTAADKFKVSYQQVYTWVRKLEKTGPDSLSDRRGKSKEAPLTELELAKLEIKRLKAENKHLELDRILSKKLWEIQRREK